MSKIHNLLQNNQTTPLLIETKFNRPQLEHNPVQRQRLLEKLDKSQHHKLTLITAPAGFGKTTLAAQWTAQTSLPSTWVSLDKNDNDVVGFWSYFIHALKTIHPGLGRQSLDFLYSSSQNIIEKIIAILINETNRYKKDFFVVLDDFQVIDNSLIYDSLIYFLNHLPHHFHLIILSRSTPSLPLASLRAKNQLLEIAGDELRFNLQESHEFFQKTLKDFFPSSSELTTLNKQLEGWVAGLQMVSIAINNVRDKNHFIQDLSYKLPHFTDYFYEEVLEQQPPEMKESLLHTSILQRMNASLCKALTGRGRELLDYLRNSNLFIISLDNQNSWFRYHHLFAQTLKSQLKEKDPELLSRLHLKAAAWFRKNGFNQEAIHHGLAGGHYEKVASWIEKEASKTFKTGNLTTLEHWIQSLPRETLYQKPKIWLYYLWILIHTRRFEEAYLSSTEMDDFLKDPNQISIFDNDSLDFLRRELNMIKYYIAVVQKKPGAEENFTKAISNMQPDSLAELITFNPGSASLLQAEAGKRGRLQDATSFYSYTAPRIEEIGDYPSFAVGYTVLSEIHYEKNQLNQAQKFFEKAIQLGKAKIDAGALVPAYIINCKIKMVKREHSSALEILRLLEQEIQENDFLHWVAVIRAFRARIAMELGHDKEVHLWLKNCRLALEDEITILQYYPYTTLVRALIYLEKYKQAHTLIERMLTILEEQKGVGQCIEILILKALCCHELNRKESALDCLQKALETGMTEGYYRIFIDEGQPLFKLISACKAQQDLLLTGKRWEKIGEYVNRLLERFIEEERTGSKPDSDCIMQIKESLTPREREVLKLLAEGYPNQAIGKELYISLVTVKTHVKNIYRKLNVKSRAKAIARINELNLLS